MAEAMRTGCFPSSHPGSLPPSQLPQMPMENMFWGDYYGELVDKFGIVWLVNCSSKV